VIDTSWWARVVRGIELAIERRAPTLIVSCSGGARMMEGALSLMQMAKISAALARLDRAQLPYDLLCRDTSEIKTLATRENRGGYALGMRRGEDKLDVRRRFLEYFQQRVKRVGA
jgi:hypothetical protein